MKGKIISELLKRMKIDCLFDSFTKIEFVNSYSLDSLDYDYINSKWEEIKSDGGYLYKAPLVVANRDNITQAGGIVYMSICTTEFKNYFIMKDTDNGIWALGVSALILINNNEEKYFVFGERNSNNINIGGAIESVGSGFVEKEDIIVQLEDEIIEEIMISKNSIDLIIPLHIGSIGKTKANNYRDICCDYFVEVSNVNLNELRKSRLEHKRLIFVPYNELLDFVNSNINLFTYRTIFTLHKYISDLYE